MAQIQSSRVSTPNDSPKKSGSQSRATTAFRTTGRMTKASWGNRFVKDFNDLTYDIKYDLIKGKAEMRRDQKFKKNKGKMFGRISSATIDTANLRGGSSEKSENIAKFMLIRKAVNPERREIVEQPKYSTLDSQGLCKYEFQKTIIGKMTHKSNNHMCFQYQTQRINNTNKVWYDQSEDLNFNKMLKSFNRNKIEKCHDFGSYTDRKVFEPREQLDKFYNTEKPFRQTKARTIKETVKINKITGRKDMKFPPGAKLSYEEQKARKLTFSRSPSYEISKSKRQLVFGRQVISPQRGCYR